LRRVKAVPLMVMGKKVVGEGAVPQILNVVGVRLPPALPIMMVLTPLR
jgi:hypothetical protein